MTRKTGVLLLNLGGPDSLDAVEPFLYNLFSDPEIIEFFGIRFLQKPLAKMIAFFRNKSVSDYYRQIGGGSPILPLTQDQAEALQADLLEEGEKVSVYIGMRYWHPFVGDTVDKILADGVEHLVVVPLYPQFSLTTTGSSVNELKRILAERQHNLKVSVIPPYYNHADYQAALAETIGQSLASHPWTCSEEAVQILFSAHSLPEKFVKQSKDPYPTQIVSTATDIMETYFPKHTWKLSYQSKVGPIPWLSPSTGEMLHQLASEGVKNLLIIPVSFVSDHLETLYEIDILYGNLANRLGITHCYRTRMLNTHPRFIKALSTLVKNKIQLHHGQLTHV